MITGKLVGVLGVGAMAITISILGKQLWQKNEDLVKARAETAVLERRVNALAAVRDGIRTAHQLCMDEIKVARADQTSAISAVRDLTEELKKDTFNVRVERQTIYKTPGCDELAKMDVAASCPALASSLRLTADRTRR